MNERLTKVGRIAMRAEGHMWNAYYALQETMEGAVFLGSIRLAAVRDNPDRKAAFMQMMRDVVGDALQDQLGARPVWGGPEKAPGRERGGRA